VNFHREGREERKEGDGKAASEIPRDLAILLRDLRVLRGKTWFWMQDLALNCAYNQDAMRGFNI
jgi:hypothetical protein